MTKERSFAHFIFIKWVGDVRVKQIDTIQWFWRIRFTILGLFNTDIDCYFENLYPYWQ